MTHARKRPPKGGKWPSREDEKAGPIVRALPAACAGELAAVEMIERLRWGDRPTGPRCGSDDVRKMLGGDGARHARFLWRCYACKAARTAGAKVNEQFAVRIGTVHEEICLPLRVWCYALWRCSSVCRTATGTP